MSSPTTVSQAVHISRDKPVRSLADLKGAKIMHAGRGLCPDHRSLGRLPRCQWI